MIDLNSRLANDLMQEYAHVGWECFVHCARREHDKLSLHFDKITARPVACQ
jgi:hypothetical protein